MAAGTVELSVFHLLTGSLLELKYANIVHLTFIALILKNLLFHDTVLRTDDNTA